MFRTPKFAQGTSEWRKHYFRADKLIEQKRYADAVMAYEDALDTCDQSDALAHIWYCCGLASSLNGDFDDAEASYSESIKAAPDEPEGYFARGISRKELEEYDLALEDFAQAFALGCREPGLYSHRAAALVNLGIVEFAYQDITDAWRLDPRKFNGHGLQIFLNSLDKHLSEHPDEAASIADRALAHQYMENPKKADADIALAIKRAQSRDVDPSRLAIVYTRLAHIYLLRGEFAAAITAGSQAIMVYWEYVPSYFMLASAQHSSGNVEEAIRLFSQCLTLCQRQNFRHTRFYAAASKRRLQNLQAS